MTKKELYSTSKARHPLALIRAKSANSSFQIDDQSAELLKELKDTVLATDSE